MPKGQPTTPVQKMLRSYSTRIKNMLAEIRRIEGRAAEDTGRLRSRIARTEVIVRALKNGELKP